MDGTENSYDHLVKILIIGASGVGKTSLMLRYVDDTFCEDIPSTIGVDCTMKTVRVGDQDVKLLIWDTMGQEMFSTVSSAHYKVDGIMVIYSRVDQESFSQTHMWFHEIERYAPEGVCRLLVGNMCDTSPTEVDEETAQACAMEQGVPFMETSAKDGTNVENAFVGLLEKILHDPTSSYNMNKMRGLRRAPQGRSACCAIQ